MDQVVSTQNNSGTKSNLQKVQDIYVKQIENAFAENSIEFDKEQKNCVLFAVNKIDDTLRAAKVQYKEVNQSSMFSVLQAVAMFRLNAINKECFLSIRNVNTATGWIKVFEFGVEGQGNDKILRTYGVDVKEVKYSFVVRENDEFTYPYFDGEKMHMPTWKPKSFVGKVSKVCYVIEKKSGELVPLIAERESVVLSVVAQIKQNLMQKQKEWGAEGKEKVNQILAKAESLNLDELLSDSDLIQYISPTYTNPASREAMIERKLRNLCCKQYPKDFKNAFIGDEYEKVVSEKVGEAEIIDTAIEVEEEKDTQKKGFETKKTIDTSEFELGEQAPVVETSKPQPVEPPSVENNVKVDDAKPESTWDDLPF